MNYRHTHFSLWSGGVNYDERMYRELFSTYPEALERMLGTNVYINRGYKFSGVFSDLSIVFNYKVTTEEDLNKKNRKNYEKYVKDMVAYIKKNEEVLTLFAL